MEFQELLQIVGEEPVFETALLLAGDVAPNHIRRQLSRWVRLGHMQVRTARARKVRASGR
jgi:hypothetical protein